MHEIISIKSDNSISCGASKKLFNTADKRNISPCIPTVLFIYMCAMCNLVLRRNGFICITLFRVFVSEPVRKVNCSHFVLGHLALTVIWESSVPGQSPCMSLIVQNSRKSTSTRCENKALITQCPFSQVAFLRVHLQTKTHHCCTVTSLIS